MIDLGKQLVSDYGSIDLAYKALLENDNLDMATVVYLSTNKLPSDELLNDLIKSSNELLEWYNNLPKNF